jgi:hypothetical protein
MPSQVPLIRQLGNSSGPKSIHAALVAAPVLTHPDVSEITCSPTPKGVLTDIISVQGLSWCRDEPKNVGLPNLTRNILCTSHNSRLSPADQAAIAAFDVLRECVRLTDVREVMKERLWHIVRLEIDGAGLERWFLKTLISITAGGKERIGPKSLAPGELSADLVEIAYGLRKFVPNAGLYSSAEMGETTTSEDRVTIIPFFN